MLKHVGIIADGNCRWASERHLDIGEGYKICYEKILEISEILFKKKIEIISFFLFPKNKWELGEEEMSRLIKLFRDFILENQDEIIERDWRILASGKINDFPGDFPEIFYDLISKTKFGKAGTINIYLNYDGREEILDAIKKMIKNNIELDQIHDGMIRKYLYNGGLSDPDLIIRTGGVRELSGFQIWQTVNSELVFFNKYWPEFEGIDILKILDTYNG